MGCRAVRRHRDPVLARATASALAVVGHRRMFLAAAERPDDWSTISARVILPGSLFTWAMIAFWLVALRDANHHNNRLATPLTQAAAASAFPCSTDALV